MSNQVVDHLNTDANLTSEDITNITKGLCNIEKLVKPEITDEDLEIYTDPIMKIICKELNYCFTKKPFLHESLLTVSEHNQLSAWEKQLAEREYVIAKRSNSRRNYNLVINEPNQTDYNNQQIPNNSYLANPNNPNNQMPYYPAQQQTIPNPVYNNSFNQNVNQNLNGYSSQSNVQQNLPHQIHHLNQNNFTNQYQMPSSNLPNHNNSSSNAFANDNYYNNYNYGSNVSQDSQQQVTSNALIPVANVQQQSQQSQQSQQQQTSQSSQNPQSHYQPYQSNFRRERIRVTQRNFIIPQDLRIKDETNEVIILKKGQLVLLIQSDNSLILRTLSGKQIQIRGPFVNYFSVVNNLHPPPQTFPVRNNLKKITCIKN